MSQPPATVLNAIAAVQARPAPFGRGFFVDVPPAWPEQQIRARWRGLTAFMGQAFFPDYDMHAVRVPRADVPHYDRAASSTREVAAKRAYAARKGVSIATAGRRFGTEVHRALDVLAMGKRTKKPLPMDARRKAEEVLARIRRMGLVVLQSEMAIRSLEAGCATSVDLVTWSPAKGVLCLIEVKCGTYGGKFEAGTTAPSTGSTGVTGPVTAFDDSPLSQAMLQAVLPASWLVAEGGLPPGSVCVRVIRVRTRPPGIIDVIMYKPSCCPGLAAMWVHRRRIADYFSAWMRSNGNRNLAPRPPPGAPKARARAKAPPRGGKRRRWRVSDEDADYVVVDSE